MTLSLRPGMKLRVGAQLRRVHFIGTDTVNVYGRWDVVSTQIAVAVRAQARALNGEAAANTGADATSKKEPNV